MALPDICPEENDSTNRLGKYPISIGIMVLQRFGRLKSQIRSEEMLYIRGFLALLAMSVALFAQGTTAVISGLVSDTQGAAVAGARIVATNGATGITVSTTTNSSGNYLLSNLEIGTYSLSVEHEGFRRYNQTGLVLNAAENRAVNIQLEVGQVSESVNVSAQAAALEEKTSVIGQTIESRNVADLPLGNRRTMNVINLSPAVVFVGLRFRAEAELQLGWWSNAKPDVLD